MAMTSMKMVMNPPRSQTAIGRMLLFRVLPADMLRVKLQDRAGSGVPVAEGVVVEDAGRVQARVHHRVAAISRLLSSMYGKAARLRGLSVSVGSRVCNGCFTWQRLCVALLLLTVMR